VHRRDGKRLRLIRQIRDRGLQLLRLAVDCDNTRAALGQQPHGRGSDDAGGPGDDSDPASRRITIGHAWFSLLVRYPDYVRRGRGERSSGGLFHLRGGLTSAGRAKRPPFPAVFAVLTGGPARGE